MCLCDKKRFRFTFKRIPIQKIVLKKANDTSYYSPYRYTSLYKKLGIYVLAKDLLTIWGVWITMDIGELKRLSFFSSDFWETLYIGIGSNLKLFKALNSISPKLSYEGNHYVFEGGFFHAFKANPKSNYDALKFFKKYCMPQHADGEKIAEAVLVNGYIPAFTRYAIGEDNDICARRMVLDI